MANQDESKANRRRSRKNRKRNAQNPSSSPSTEPTPESPTRSSNQSADPVCHVEPVTNASPTNPNANLSPLRNSTIDPAADLTIDASKVISPTSKSKPSPVVPPGFEPKQEDAMPDLPLTLTVVSCVLHGIPQNPHFFPLKKYTGIIRKGLMPGWHQAFVETVNQIKSLAILRFWDKARELWETIEELQSMGYNVIPLRRRLVELTDLTKVFIIAVLEVSQFKIKAENHRLKKSLIESMLLDLLRRINMEELYMDFAKIEGWNKENEVLEIGTAFTRLAADQLKIK